MTSIEINSSKTTLLASHQLKHALSKHADLKALKTVSNDNEYYIKDKQNVPWYMKYKLRWRIIILAVILYSTATYGLLTFPYIQKYKTFLWALVIGVFSLFGITAGIHRLWTHKAYKAKLPLQIILASGFVLTLQAPFSHWIRIHRVHHKFTDTDADPHDSTKGFFFSHIGWLLIKKPRDVSDKFKDIDMSDIDQNPVITFFDRHIVLASFIATTMTILVPVYFWNEEWKSSLISQFVRFAVIFNIAASVNSFAHMWGDKPFNKYIKPVDNKVVSFFPFDYRTPEFLGPRYIDFTGKMIELFKEIGWAYDLRQPTDAFIKRTIKNKGDELLQALVH